MEIYEGAAKTGDNVAAFQYGKVDAQCHFIFPDGEVDKTSVLLDGYPETSWAEEVNGRSLPSSFLPHVQVAVDSGNINVFRKNLVYDLT